MRVMLTRALVLLAALVLYPAAATPQTMDEFFDDTVVHDIRITINSKDWNALKQKFLENTFYPVTLRWRNVSVPNVGIRSRGLGSRSATKPGLKFDIDHFAAQQTFLDLKSFVLDNLVQDSSMLRERVSMAMFRRLGMPAPREAHARLFVNEQYAGMYAIVESIDKGFLGRNFGADSDGGVENDGYLFEYDYIRDYRFEYLGSNLDEYAIFDPKTNERKAAAQIWGPIEEMVQTINESPDQTFTRDASRYLDLGLFARHLAAEAFLAENDGILGYAGMNNFYMYRFEDSDRSQFLPWDKDNTFVDVGFPVLRGVAENVLARRTLNEPQFRNRFLDSLLEASAIAEELDPETAELNEDGEPIAGPGWLEREITRQYTQIRTLARADTFKPHANDEFEEAYLQLLDFARNRSAIVRAQVQEIGRGNSNR